MGKNAAFKCTWKYALVSSAYFCTNGVICTLKTSLRVGIGLAAFFVALSIWFLPGLFLKFLPPQFFKLTGLVAVKHDFFSTGISAFFYISASFLLVFLLQTKLDKRPFYEIGLQPPGKEMYKYLGIGALLGCILFAAIPCIQWLCGVIKYHGNINIIWQLRNGMHDAWLFPLAGFFKSLAIGFSEELNIA